MNATRRPLSLLADAAGFFGFVLRRWSEDRCPQIAGGLAFTTLLAIVPMFAIVVAVVSSAPFFGDVLGQIRAFLVLNLLPQVAGKVMVYVEDFAANAQRLTFPGTIFLFVVSMMLMLMVDRSLNAIWRSRRARSLVLLVPVYAVVVVAGPVLLGVSVSITSYLASLALASGAMPEGWNAAFIRAITLGSSIAAFFLLYKVIPHRHVPWRHASFAAVVAALLFEGAKESFALYVRTVPTYGILYGAFAAVPIFLLWLYVSWLVVLFGAELAASAGYWRDGVWKRAASAGTHFHEAVQIVRRLMAAGRRGLSFIRLRAVTRLSAHDLEDTLGRMVEAGILARGGRRGYVLAGDPELITLGELYEAVAAPVGGMRPEDWAEISPDFARTAAEMREGLQRPLVSLSRKLSASPPKRRRR